VINIYIYCGVYEHGLGIGGLPGRGQTPSTTPLIAAGRHVSNAKCEDDGATGGIPWACLSGRLSRTDWAHRATITWCRACPVSQHNPEKIEMHMPQPAHFSVSIATRSNPYRCDARRMLLRREGGNGQAAGKARWHIIITYSSIKDWVCGKKINFQPASVSGPSSAEFWLAFAASSRVPCHRVYLPSQLCPARELCMVALGVPLQTLPPTVLPPRCSTTVLSLSSITRIASNFTSIPCCCCRASFLPSSHSFLPSVVTHSFFSRLPCIRNRFLSSHFAICNLGTLAVPSDPDQHLATFTRFITPCESSTEQK
jgi:hypothetical protein